MKAITDLFWKIYCSLQKWVYVSRRRLCFYKKIGIWKLRFNGHWYHRSKQPGSNTGWVWDHQKRRINFSPVEIVLSPPPLFHLPLSTCFRTKGQARALVTLTTLCVPDGSPGVLLGSRSSCHPLQPLHTQPQDKSHIPSTAQAAQWAEYQKPLLLTQRGAPHPLGAVLDLGSAMCSVNK